MCTCSVCVCVCVCVCVHMYVHTDRQYIRMSYEYSLLNVNLCKYSFLQRFSNSLVEMVEEAKGDAWRLVLLVADNFPCYRDVAEFKRRQVSLLKRSQIFVSDLCFMFGGRSYGKLDRMDQLTMFPDYRVPQVG